MATNTRTTADALLLDVVEPEMARALNEEVLGFELATRSKKDWSGRKVIFDVNMSLGGGVAPRPEAISGVAPGLPAPGKPTHVNGEVYFKELFGVVELTHDVIESSRGDKAAFAEVLADNLDATCLRLKKYGNFAFYGDGRGILGTIATNGGGSLAKASAATRECTFDTSRYMSEGDRVAFWTSSSETSTVLANGGQSYTDGTYDSEAVYISSIASDGVNATVKRDRAAADDATIADANVLRMYQGTDYNAGTLIHSTMMGLRGFADDGTLVGTLEGISRTTYPKWKGVCLAASSLTEGTTLARNHFYKLAHAVYRNCGKQVDTFIMDPTLMREFLNIADPNVRFAPVGQHDPGYSKDSLQITIGSKSSPLFMDYECPFGCLFAFPKSELEYWSMTDLELDRNMGGILKQPKPYGATGSGDIFYAFARMKGNWATKRPFSFGVLTGLAYSAENA